MHARLFSPLPTAHHTVTRSRVSHPAIFSSRLVSFRFKPRPTPRARVVQSSRVHARISLSPVLDDAISNDDARSTSVRASLLLLASTIATPNRRMRARIDSMGRTCSRTRAVSSRSLLVRTHADASAPSVRYRRHTSVASGVPSGATFVVIVVLARRIVARRHRAAVCGRGTVWRVMNRHACTHT